MILCCGEALIDMLPRQLSDSTDVFLPVPGGAVFNTAIALGRLGERTGFLSGVSTDMFGEQLIEALEASNVDPSLCIRSAQPTTMAFVKLIDGHATYSFYDENSAGRSISHGDLPAISEAVEAMHFGAISLIPEPCGTAYETLMRDWHEKTVISLDPNIRPSFITDPEAYRARMERMIAMADIVKVSDEDLDWLAKGESNENLFQKWLSEGTSLILLTKGSEGVTAFTRAGNTDQAAEKTQVIDTVGAGDTFNAGILAGLRDTGVLSKSALKNAELTKIKPALALASRAAAWVVGQAGANPPWKNDLEKS